MKRLSLALLICLSCSVAAGQKPRPGAVDQRIKTVVYDKRNVTEIIGHYGFFTQIVFSPSEGIIDAPAGDELAWEIAYEKGDNHLFVKPRAESGDTNIVVTTDKRLYVFDLKSHASTSRDSSDLTYQIYFQYPGEELRASLASERLKQRLAEADDAEKADNGFSVHDLNWRYTKTGDDNLVPLRVFDDGRFTYFQFDKSRPIPAVFIVKADKSETLVNPHKDGDYYVVQRVAGQFALRDTGIVTCIYNETWNAAVSEQAGE